MYSRTAEATLRLPEALCPPSQSFPAVLFSSRLVELMELASARLMRPRLDASQASTAIRTHLHHVAGVSPAGGELRAVAVCRGISGRLHHFEVNVFDANGLIASGEHSRAVVVARRVEALARRRHGRPSFLLL